MALLPPTFIEDLKTQTDIVAVIGDVTPLRKTGATWKGLCPFHTEKTPSFHVNPDKGFFKCFGCDAKGDVVKFIELQQKLPFLEAVRWLAQRAGMAMPEAGTEDREGTAEREAILKLHETAAEFFKSALASPAGARARRELESRGLSGDTLGTFGYGYAPAGGRETLQALLASQGVPVPVQIRSGLVREREGRLIDYFRNRLMIPIGRDTGAVVAFGGRALDEGQQPKYLNSPETPIYTKGRTLYGLDVTKGAIRKHNYCVLVEGYFDLAQVWQAGVQPVVALCGTALTPAQARILKRFTSKVVLSLDPDGAGKRAAAASSEVLVGEGFQVNVAELPEGADPDVFIRRSGAPAYVERLKGSRPYLEFLLDRAATGMDLTRQDDRKTFLDRMLTVAAMIPDAASRDQFADKLAHKARITESVIRDEIRKAASQKRTTAPAAAIPAVARVRLAEQGLLWTLVHRPVEGLAAVAQLEAEDLEGLTSASILRQVSGWSNLPPEMLPDLLRERLSEGERAMVERAASPDAAVAAPADCVNEIKRLRMTRELAEIQEAIDRLQERERFDDQAFGELWERKKTLLHRLETLAG
jgi:DNA primase